MEEYRNKLEALYLKCSDINKVENSREGLA